MVVELHLHFPRSAQVRASFNLVVVIVFGRRKYKEKSNRLDRNLCEE